MIKYKNYNYRLTYPGYEFISCFKFKVENNLAFLTYYSVYDTAFFIDKSFQIYNIDEEWNFGDYFRQVKDILILE